MSGEREAEGSSLPVIRVSARARVSAGTRVEPLARRPAVAVFPAGFRADLSGEEIKPRPGPSLRWAAAPLGCPETGVCLLLQDFCCRGTRSPSLCVLPVHSWLLLPQNVSAFRFKYLLLIPLSKSLQHMVTRGMDTCCFPCSSADSCHWSR